MKYAIILGDGMADRPIQELDGKTPLEYADTPTLDMLAPLSEIGVVYTIPYGMSPGSDTANLAVLGYDPKKYYSGRSPLEALSIGVDMEDTDIALRANIVTLTEDEPFENKTILDHSSGEISTEDAKILLDALRKELENDEFRFYAGTSYRHCCIWKNGRIIELSQPHDHLGEKIGQYIPKEPAFRQMMEKSYYILKDHPINIKRIQEGKNPANCLWFWGAGTKPKLPSFKLMTDKKAAMISAVDLLKGIAVGTSMKVIDVQGANGSLDTNYEGKARAALDALLKDGLDLVYVHVEAPDEMGHQGNVQKKVKSIEYLDKRLIKPVYEGLKASGEDFRLLVMPDHPTPIEIRTHSSDPVPYLIYDNTKYLDRGLKFTEKDAGKSSFVVAPGYDIMDRLLDRVLL